MDQNRVNSRRPGRAVSTRLEIDIDSGTRERAGLHHPGPRRPGPVPSQLSAAWSHRQRQDRGIPTSDSECGGPGSTSHIPGAGNLAHASDVGPGWLPVSGEGGPSSQPFDTEAKIRPVVEDSVGRIRRGSGPPQRPFRAGAPAWADRAG